MSFLSLFLSFSVLFWLSISNDAVVSISLSPEQWKENREEEFSFSLYHKSHSLIP